MNIESGVSSAGIAVSAGPAMGPAITVGTMDFGPKIINEGPVALSFLEKTMSITHDPFGLQKEIIFNPLKEEIGEPLVIQQAEEVAARAWDRTEDVLVEAETAPNLELNLGWQPIPTPGVSPHTTVAVEAKPQPKPKEEEQTTAFTFIKPELASQRKEVEVEQVKIGTGLEDKKSPVKEQDLEEVVKRKFLVDEQALQVRLSQLRQAIRLASKTDTFDGEMIKRFMPEEDESNRSEALRVDDPDRRYPDGGYLKILEDIGLWGELKSEQEALNKGRVSVEENGPVKKGKDGNQAPIKHVWRAYERFPVKPPIDISNPYDLK